MAGPAKRRLHESTSRAFARLSFVLLGVLPLVVCLVVCGLQYVPYYQRLRAAALEDELGEVLDLKVDLAAIEPLTPNRSRLHRIRLVHPETGDSIARIAFAEVERRRGQWAIHLGPTEIEGRHFRVGLAKIHDALICRPQVRSLATRLAAADVKVFLGDDELALSLTEASIIPDVETTLANLEFRLRTDDETTDQVVSPASLVLKRFHEESQLETQMLLRSGGAPLPGRFVKLFWPSAEYFGSNATLLGEMHARVSNGRWQAQVEARRSQSADLPVQGGLWIQNVDFSQLCVNFPGALSGTGEVWIEKARVTQAGLTNIQGAASIGEGNIRRDLLASMQHNLGVNLAPNVAQSAGRLIGFTQGQIRFDIAPTLLQLEGLLPQGGILADSAGVFASRPTAPALPLEHLLQVLSQLDPMQTPHSQSGELFRLAQEWLPLRRSSTSGDSYGLPVNR